MLKQQAKIFKSLNILVDLCVVLAAFIVACKICQRRNISVTIDNYLWVILAILFIWHFLMKYFRLYVSLRTLSVWNILMSILKVHLIGGIAVSSLIYLLYEGEFSRVLFGLFLTISCFSLAIERIAVKMTLGNLRRKGFNYRNILIVGTEAKALDFVRLLEHHLHWGLKVLGFVQSKDDSQLLEFDGYKVLGNTDQIVEICKNNPVDEVVFYTLKYPQNNMKELIADIQELGVVVRMVLDLYDLRMHRSELSLFRGEIPILTYYPNVFDDSQLFLKRCIDLAGASVGLFATAIILPLVAIAIKLDSKGPVFFSQERVGVNGRVFRCWKFRSMHTDAEKRRSELLNMNEMKGAIFKIK
ncbi:MAG: sugar transferase, partial [Deltaproteobacteria bacterium]